MVTTIRRGADRLSVFVATLGWSRAAYVEFVPDERLETLLACHEHAFLAFGGASWMTAVSAFSPIRRGSRNPGK